MGWANSSLRRPEELPYLGTLQDLKDAKGVVREDPVEAALSLDSSRAASHEQVTSVIDFFLLCLTILWQFQADLFSSLLSSVCVQAFACA